MEVILGIWCEHDVVNIFDNFMSIILVVDIDDYWMKSI